MGSKCRVCGFRALGLGELPSLSKREAHRSVCTCIYIYTHVSSPLPLYFRGVYVACDVASIVHTVATMAQDSSRCDRPQMPSAPLRVGTSGNRVS